MMKIILNTLSVIIALIVLFIGYKLNWNVYFTSLLGCISFVAINTFFSNRELRHLASQRLKDGYDKESIFKNLKEQGISISIYELLLENLKPYTLNGDLPVLPDDDVGKIYGIVEEDLDELFEDVLKQSGRVIPKEYIPPEKPIRTVQEIAKLIGAFPFKEECH